MLARGESVMDIDKRLDELREQYKSYIRYCHKVERTKPYSPGEQDFNATIQLNIIDAVETLYMLISCLLYTSPSPRDRQKSRMPSSA